MHLIHAALTHGIYGRESFAAAGLAAVLVTVGLARLFRDAGFPVWHALVPGLNVLGLLRLTGRPWWWAALMVVPVVGAAIVIHICIDIAHHRGRGGVTALTLAFAMPVALPVLAFATTPAGRLATPGRTD